MELMTEYIDKVQRQALMLEAEEWAKGIAWIHAHRLKSMWYDDRPQDTDKGSVMDVMYNNGLIERTLADGKKIYFGKRLSGDALLYEYERHSGSTALASR
tara:strand:- start:1014 stop:1313 length:300 start_codon:yes stop_codon:yes gene_type:complete